MDNTETKEINNNNGLTILSKPIRILNKIVDLTSFWLGLFGGISLAAMMFLTFIDIAGTMLGKWSLISAHTDFFGPIIGGYEITSFMMLILVSCALVYCAQKKGHIRVDVILQQLSGKKNAWFSIVAYTFSIVFCVFLMWQSFSQGIDNINYDNVSAILFVPLSPFNFFLSLGLFFFVLVFLRDLLSSIEEAMR